MNKYLGPLRAEWLKIKRNYKFNSFLVWILPIGVSAFYTFMIVGALIVKEPSEELIIGCFGTWTNTAAGAWNFLRVFPGSIFGRILPLAFFAVVMAGEYQWGTWKNIVPLNLRLNLLFSKGLVATLTVISSITLTALLSAGGQSLVCNIEGAFYGPVFSGAVLLNFLGDFALSSTIGILVLLLILGFATLASILSRSVLGGFLGGFVLSLLELFSLGLLYLLRNIFNNPGIVNLYRFAPGFNLDNLQSWFFQSQSYSGELLGMAVEYSVFQSLAVLGFWILVPTLLAAILFQRQDITS